MERQLPHSRNTSYFLLPNGPPLTMRDRIPSLQKSYTFPNLQELVIEHGIAIPYRSAEKPSFKVAEEVTLQVLQFPLFFCTYNIK